MKNKAKHLGLTLVELLIVMAVMTILMSVSMPAIKAIMESFDSTTSVRQLINAALSSARATAIKEQTYAGVRFQKDKTGDTYMIFIVHDPSATDYVNAFRAAVGRSPMKMPKTAVLLLSPPGLPRNDKITIVFSPQGKLASHNVRVRNKDGKTDNSSMDNVFNTEMNVKDGKAMFVQDIGGIGNDIPSVKEFYLNGKMERISPYTGQLVMEYRD